MKEYNIVLIGENSENVVGGYDDLEKAIKSLREYERHHELGKAEPVIRHITEVYDEDVFDYDDWPAKYFK